MGGGWFRQLGAWRLLAGLILAVVAAMAATGYLVCYHGGESGPLAGALHAPSGKKQEPGGAWAETAIRRKEIEETRAMIVGLLDQSEVQANRVLAAEAAFGQEAASTLRERRRADNLANEVQAAEERLRMLESKAALRAKVDTMPGPAKNLTLDLGGGATMKMVLIPAGKFMMGEEKDPHEVTISKPFYMGVTEVTQAQYQAVMGTNPSNFKGAANPVEMVSWNDATEFCKKLSEKTRQAVRLPTEAEWEYACRAGTATAFSFGDSDSALGDYSWYTSNSGSTTHPVGQKKPNAWGLYDIHGNVWEWCQDWFDAYAAGAVTDPQGPASGMRRVLRGGCWDP